MEEKWGSVQHEVWEQPLPVHIPTLSPSLPLCTASMTTTREAGYLTSTDGSPFEEQLIHIPRSLVVNPAYIRMYHTHEMLVTCSIQCLVDNCRASLW